MAISTAEKLYKKYRKLMKHIAYQILEDGQLAEDAVHDTMEKVINHMDSIDDIDSPQTRNFLSVVCKYTAMDIYRKRKKIQSLNTYETEDDILQDSKKDLNPLSIVLSRESVHEIENIIMNLNPKYRDVFLLSYSKGYTNKKIAELLNISENAAYKRMKRAKELIITELQRRDRNEWE